MRPRAGGRARASGRATLPPGWPRAGRPSAGPAGVDPLAPPVREPARSRRALRSSSSVRVGAAPGPGRQVWLGLLAFLGAAALVVVAAEVTIRLLRP